MASKRVTKSLINTALTFKTLAADGANSTGGVVSTTLTGASVGDRILSIFGQIKANTGANSFLVPVLGTAFEKIITVKDHVQQLQAGGDLSANTYLFILEPARMTIRNP